MKSYRVGAVALLAAACAALSACGPVQAGSAAIVGKERITSSQLDDQIQEFRKDLAANKMTEDQLGLQLPLPQMILLNMVNSRQFLELGRSKGVTVTDREIDDVVNAQGGQAQFDKVLLASGIPLDEGREAVRSVLIRQKLAQQEGAGADQQSQQAALQKLTQEAEAAVPVKYSPRYGKFDPQQGFVPDDRFGIAAEAPQAPAAGMPEAGDGAPPPDGAAPPDAAPAG
ncbi:SurA N-terminal domain-containing protein [Microbispora sp. RL4-1S]|uniref:SurA N-terminal domain-containing protein n=1 Tax=Microbispora oryzae TaxID=2806554 RepID=A0A941AK80_9ACTN|nr:SurA N-terminal domain-containing protein [Microbispora oryzae]MBP2707200.1 SurA N-terminal domain-containing protein [Microbispora oryzae]